MNNLRKQLARKMKQLRGDQTLRAFGRKVGMDASHLSRIEQAKENVTIDTLQKLCDNLKCSLADLFNDQEEKIS